MVSPSPSSLILIVMASWASPIPAQRNRLTMASTMQRFMTMSSSGSLAIFARASGSDGSLLLGGLRVLFVRCLLVMDRHVRPGILRDGGGRQGEGFLFHRAGLGGAVDA